MSDQPRDVGADIVGRDTRVHRASARTVAGGSIYVGLTISVAAVAAWPIYASPS